MDPGASTTSFHSHVASTNTGSSNLSTPQHPIPALHPPFLESIRESTGSLAFPASSSRAPKGAYHRITKVISQLTFGLHLLHNNLAKSESECVAILQTHIDTLDAFLSKKAAAISDASSDIAMRLDYLRIPLAPNAIAVFDRMLESREFRGQILKRNDNLEYVVRRTTQGLDRAMRDTEKTIEAVDTCATYLDAIRDGWGSERLERVYDAMRHNVQMWRRCCVALQAAGENLRANLVELAALVLEVESRTGKASRRSAGMDRKGGMVMRWQHTVVEKPLPETPRMEEQLETMGIKGSEFERLGTSEGIRLRHSYHPDSRPATRETEPRNDYSQLPWKHQQKSRQSLPILSQKPDPRGHKLLKRAGSTGRMLAKKVANRCSVLRLPHSTSAPQMRTARSWEPHSTATMRWVGKSEKTAQQGNHGDAEEDGNARGRRSRCRALCMVL